jgi:selenocysteine-specific elongation factor
VRRGDVVATPGYFKPVRMVGARLSALPDLERPISNRMAIRLHTGTVEALGEVVLLDQEELAPGATGLVQLRLEEPVVCAPGDRFVVRLASPALTLGGGVILEESKHRLKRFKDFVVDELSRQAQSLESPRELLEVVLSRAASGTTTPDELAVEIKRSKPETERLLNDLKGQGRAHKLGANRWIHAERLEASLAKVEHEIERWFAAHEHREVIDVRELRKSTGFHPEFLDLLLAEETRREKLALEPGGLIRPRGRAAALDPETAELADRVIAALTAARFQPPTPAELALALGKPEKSVQAVLELLVDREDVAAITREFHLVRAAYEEARAAVVSNCEKNRALDIPSLRDALATTRKFLIPLLEHFDTHGVTLRQGGHRVLKRR